MITESCMFRVLNLHGHLVGRNRSLQVVRKQFALRPAAAAAARTTHRSQGDTETIVVVKFDTRRDLPGRCSSQHERYMLFIDDKVTLKL